VAEMVLFSLSLPSSLPLPLPSLPFSLSLPHMHNVSGR
jgi:hypothetical protein